MLLKLRLEVWPNSWQAQSFISNLVLMYDTLQEISILSLDLQSHAMTVPRAEHLIKRTIRVIQSRKDQLGEKRALSRFTSRDRGNISKYCADFKWKNKEDKCQPILTKYSDNMQARLCTEDSNNAELLKI